MTELKPYPEYKNSGVDWSTSCPSTWQVMRLGRIVELSSGEPLTGVDIDPIGEFPVFGAGGFRGYTDRFTHSGEYPLVGRVGALCGNVRLARGRFFATEHALIASPRVPVDVRWLTSMLETMNLGQYSQAAAQPVIASERLSKVAALYPPIDDQVAIGDFLDRETAEIDAFIAGQEQLIELLTERRAATISHAVTKGLDPTVPMKDSGIEWLGAIPESWETSCSSYGRCDQRGVS